MGGGEGSGGEEELEGGRGCGSKVGDGAEAVEDPCHSRLLHPHPTARSGPR